MREEAQWRESWLCKLDDASGIDGEIDGQKYEQGVFKYQMKCLDDLKARFAALPEEAKNLVCGLIGEEGVNILG